MGKQSNLCQIEHKLLSGWLGARSIARGLPQPVLDHGGLRVDTGLPNENRRYIFTGPIPGIRELALSINAPLTFIKMCGPGEQLLELVPPRWELQPAAYLMTRDGELDAIPTVPAGYRLEVAIEYPVIAARIFAEDGTLAASGYAVECGGVFIFDRIVTETAHQRRGLGSAVMAALGSMQQSSVAQRVLVATEAGRALYSTLGWTVRSPYSTVVINARKD